MTKNVFEEAAAKVYAAKTSKTVVVEEKKSNGGNSFDEEIKQVDLSNKTDMLIAGSNDASSADGFEGVAYVDNLIKTKFQSLHEQFKTLDSYRTLSAFLDMLYEAGRDVNFKVLADLTLYFYYQK